MIGIRLDLAAPLATLLGPWKVSDWDNEEAVGVVGDTSKRIIPGKERSEETKVSSSFDAARVWSAPRVIEVSNAEKQEGQIKSKEEREEGHRRFQRADEEQEREDEPSHQVEAEGVKERAFSKRYKIALNVEASWSEDDGEGEPEATVRRESSGTESVSDSHFPHAGEKLDETAIPVGKGNYEIGMREVSSSNIDQRQDKGSQREGRETERRRVAKI